MGGLVSTLGGFIMALPPLGLHTIDGQRVRVTSAALPVSLRQHATSAPMTGSASHNRSCLFEEFAHDHEDRRARNPQLLLWRVR